MGSGETAPTMAKVHRALFERLGPAPVPAAILDTPYGFQENADELSARTVQFFAESVGREVAVASYRSRDVDARDRRDGRRAAPRGALPDGRTRQPELRPAPVGRRADPAPPSRAACATAAS